MPKNYKNLVTNIFVLIEDARRASVRSVNAILTMAYWEIGRRVVQFEQDGQDRAKHGEKLLKRLSTDLQRKAGRGFTERNLRNMRQFYLYWPKLFNMKLSQKRHAVSAESFTLEKWHSLGAELSWTHYRRL
jgi:hypothetical protein